MIVIRFSVRRLLAIALVSTLLAALPVAHESGQGDSVVVRRNCGDIRLRLAIDFVTDVFKFECAERGALGRVAPGSSVQGRGVIAVPGQPNADWSLVSWTRFVYHVTHACISHFQRSRACHQRRGEHFQTFHEPAAAMLSCSRIKSVQLLF